MAQIPRVESTQIPRVESILENILDNHHEPRNFVDIAKEYGFRVKGNRIYPPNEREGTSINKDYWLEILAWEIARAHGMVIPEPKRPKPDFIKVDTKPNKELLNYTLKNMAKMPFTSKGNPANPKEFEKLSMVADVAMFTEKFDRLEELRKKYHPEFPYEARQYVSPQVVEVGEKTLQFRVAPWMCVVRGIELDTPRPYRHQLIEAASKGYIVWNDGFAVKSEMKAFEWTNKTSNFSRPFEFDWQTVKHLLRCAKNNILIFTSR